MKGPAAKAARHLESLGYEWVTTNSKCARVYVNSDGDKRLVLPSMTESQHRDLLRTLNKHHGVREETNKRRPEQIKSRAATDRDLAVCRRQKRQHELDVLIAAKAQEWQIQQAVRAVEAAERDVRVLEQLMREVPVSSAAAPSDGTAA